MSRENVSWTYVRCFIPTLFMYFISLIQIAHRKLFDTSAVQIIIIYSRHHFFSLHSTFLRRKPRFHHLHDNMAIILFVNCFLISVHFASTLTNFDHNPTCLLMSTLRSESRQSDLTLQYDNHLSFAHRSALVVKHLPSNITINTFFTWKMNCIEIVTFYESGNPAVFLHDLSNWGYQANVVIYTVFSVWAHNNLRRDDMVFSYLESFYTPIYLIQLNFWDDGIKIYSGFLHPTKLNWLKEWEIIPPPNGEAHVSLMSFPPGDALIRERRMSDNNQNRHRLPIEEETWVPFLQNDCENHRYFVSMERRCFAVNGPLLILQRKLNITFVPKRG